MATASPRFPPGSAAAADARSGSVPIPARRLQTFAEWVRRYKAATHLQTLPEFAAQRGNGRLVAIAHIIVHPTKVAPL